MKEINFGCTYDLQRDFLQLEKDLPLLQCDVQKIIDNKKKDCDVNEIINEAIIIMATRQLFYSVSSFKSICFDTIMTWNSNVTNVEYTDWVKTLPNNIPVKGEWRECKTCKTSLPIQMFHINKRYPSGLVLHNSECKECQKKRNYDNLKRRMEDPVYREQYLEKMRNRQKKRELVIKNNPRLKAYYSVLKRKADKKYIASNPEKRRITNMLSKMKQRNVKRSQAA